MADLFIPAVIFLASSLLLVKSASQAVKYILELARELSVTPFMASFVLAGMVSILPEFFVGVNSALDHAPDIGIGTLIGNNIVDLTLVVGIIVILGREIPAKGLNRLSTPAFLIAVGLPLALMLDGELGFFDGFILVAAAVIYFAYMLTKNKIRESKKPINVHKLVPSGGLFLLMMGIIYLSSKYVVESSVELSHAMGIPEIFAGLFLISLGAALPELTFSIQAVLSNHKSMGLADVLGNVALDATFSIGVMAMIVPIPINVGIIGISTLVMAFAALLLTTYLDNDGKLTRRDGIALVGLYVVFVVIQFTTHGILHPAELPVELPHP